MNTNFHVNLLNGLEVDALAVPSSGKLSRNFGFWQFSRWFWNKSCPHAKFQVSSTSRAGRTIMRTEQLELLVEQLCGTATLHVYVYRCTAAPSICEL